MGKPAVVYSDGEQFWLKNGELHREDGPAIIYANGKESYYLDGKKYTKEEFDQKINPPKEPEIDTILIDGVKYKLTQSSEKTRSLPI